MDPQNILNFDSLRVDLQKSWCSILYEENREQKLGQGFHYGGGYVFTCAHVLSCTESVRTARFDFGYLQITNENNIDRLALIHILPSIGSLFENAPDVMMVKLKQQFEDGGWDLVEKDLGISLQEVTDFEEHASIPAMASQQTIIPFINPNDCKGMDFTSQYGYIVAADEVCKLTCLGKDNSTGFAVYSCNYPLSGGFSGSPVYVFWEDKVPKYTFRYCVSSTTS